MTLVPASQEICQQVSDRAAQLAKENIASLGWSNRSIQAMVAYAQDGKIGIKSTLKYLIHQDRGIRPFVMWWAEGRTIPMGGPDGVHFVKAVGVGTPGYVTLPGGVRKWRDQRWKHPGLDPKNFMENALKQAVQDSRPGIQQMMMSAITGGRHNAR
jgi:hypothetical protein